MLEAVDALAKVYLQLGKNESAAVAAGDVLAERPADVAMLRLRHEALAALGERERARRALDDLMAHDPGEGTATLLYNAAGERFLRTVVARLERKAYFETTIAPRGLSLREAEFWEPARGEDRDR